MKRLLFRILGVMPPNPPTERQVDALTAALVLKVNAAGWALDQEGESLLLDLVRQVVIDTWLVADGTIALSRFVPEETK